ncbi:MAG TPA: ABC transporter ATP-binding protein [Hyphomicrobiales bacterium]|nr:ABC transporter ATP-binding protein [Hyphomicrobiales bacterium]
MNAAAPAIEVAGIGKSFGGLVALDEVSFRVAPGEIVGLIGPNGAGKSTLFEVISGSMPPSGGRVMFYGADVTRRPAHLRRRDGLCRTFQKVRLFDTLTVQQNIAVAAMQSVPEGTAWQTAAEHALVRMRLTALARRKPSELTLADRKKVEIARAMAGFCRVLMLDESLSGLTHEEADELVGEIRELNRREGLTIVIVEHVMSVIVALAQRLIVLQHGRLIADGTPAEVVRNPVVVEAYLGTRRRVTA